MPSALLTHTQNPHDLDLDHQWISLVQRFTSYRINREKLCNNSEKENKSNTAVNSAAVTMCQSVNKLS